MSGKPPVLDKRVLKDILEQLQALARIDVPEWQAPAQGDAGTMLQRMFARLLEIELERLNQVPDKNLLAFLDTMGVSLLPPSPAKAPLTFMLAPDSPPTLVPQGTQAGGAQEAVIFETEDDLTVIPAQIIAGRTMDPTWDRFTDYTDPTPILGGENPTGFTPFVGTQRMPHILYLGDDALLNFNRATNVEVILDWQSSRSPTEVTQFFQGLAYQYRTQGTVKTIAPATDVPTPAPRPIHIPFTISDAIDQEKRQGVGLEEGIEKRWLLVVLTTPFPDSLVARDLQCTTLKLKLNANNLLPEFAFGNNARLDVTRDFLPFGDTPEVGDALYLGSEEVFSKPDATVTISVTVKPPTLEWEYWSDEKKTWRPLGPDNDGTKSFKQSGTLSQTCPPDMVPTLVGGETAYWFRVRMLSGNYPGAPYITDFRLSGAQTTLEKVGADQNNVKLKDPDFASPGTVLLIEDEFALVVAVIDEREFVVTPQIVGEPAQGAPVERREISAPIASLRLPAREKTIFLSVNATELINRNDVLLIRDEEQPEFITVLDIQPDGAHGFRIISVKPLRFSHNPNVSLSRVIPYFFGFAEGRRLEFTEPFFPYGAQPSAGDVFYFGTTTGFPPDIEIDVELALLAPNVDLQWEFLRANEWLPLNLIKDETNNLLQSGDIEFLKDSVIECAEAEVNDQSSYWIRVRLAGGNYGRPVEYVQADPEDPEKGFTVDPDTGNLNPPVISKLTLTYDAEREPTVLSQNGFLYHNHTKTNNDKNLFAPFLSVKDLTPSIYADTESSLYLGFNAAFPEKPVTLYIAVAARAIAGRVVKEMRTVATSSSILPPLKWEYFNGTRWGPLTVLDETNNLTESGPVKFLTPTDMAQLAKFDLTDHYWIRVRSSENDPFDTQRILGVYLNTMPATQAVTVAAEILGSSNGQSHQALTFINAPVLPGQEVRIREPEPPSGLELEVIEEEEGERTKQEGKEVVERRLNPDTGETEIWVRWHEVPNFLCSEPHHRHYTLSRTQGLVTFGGPKRGLIPPGGTNSIAATYRSGGGIAGNVLGGEIAQIKSTLPAVASVTNPVPADGGAKAETVPMVKERGPQTLKHRNRAVACADIEWLARHAVGTGVARSKCLSNINRDLRFEPGWVTLLIVPQGKGQKLSPGSELIRQVENALEERAFIGLSSQIPARVNVVGPGYIQVTVVAKIVPKDIDEAEQVKGKVIDALNRFFHALTGGPEGTGWVFGRDVYASEICKVIEDVSDVSHVAELESLRRIGLELIPNIAQHRLTFTSGTVAAMDFPESSAVMTDMRDKAMLLAEPVPMGSGVERIAVKGFKEGDRITKVQDFIVESVSSDTSVTVQQFGSDAVGFPRGSLVTTFDGTRLTHLKEAIPRSEPTVSQIAVEEAAFMSQLRQGDVLTVFYPFPMTITSVTVDREANTQILGIGPYDMEVPFPEDSLLATLDNRVRLPLKTKPQDSIVKSVELADFTGGDGADAIRIVRNDQEAETAELTIDAVQPVKDIVYLDDNFLIYPGAHRITMVSDPRVASTE